MCTELPVYGPWQRLRNSTPRRNLDGRSQVANVYEIVKDVGLVDKTSDFLAECLVALDQELQKITKKPAYNSAEQIS
jgi:hypothetical protein